MGLKWNKEIIKKFVKRLYKKNYVKVEPKFDGMNIDNLTVYNFYKRDKVYIEDRVGVLKHLQPKGEFSYRRFGIKQNINISKIDNLTFDTVKQLQPIIRGVDPIREMVIVLEELIKNYWFLPNITTKQITKIILNTKIIDFFYFYNFINEGIKNIIIWEKQGLTYEATADEENANLSAFDKYGVYATIRGLSENIIEDDIILKLPYYKIFTMLMWKKDTRDYQKRLSDIQLQRQKQKPKK